jgi:arabinose-5-phosphate isomerase
MSGNERRDWVALARQVLDAEIDGLHRVRDNLDTEFERALEMIARSRGRVFVTGIGKSGLVGRKIAATLSSTGTPASFLHPVEGAHGDLGMIREGDVVVAISNSGETDELNAVLPTMLSLGSRLVGMTARRDSTMGAMCHVVLNTSVPREACTLNLAPTASTTATLALGDALAVGLIEWKAFGREDFQRYHPGGDLGRQLSLSVEQVMHSGDLPVVREGTALRESLRLLDSGGLGTVVILDSEGRLQGILTDGDVRRMICHKRYSLEDEVEAHMTVRPRYAREGEKTARLLESMEQNAITVLPVVDQERRLVGIVHLHDLLGKGKIAFNGRTNADSGGMPPEGR